MKIVVTGGSGLIGSKLVTQLRARGHEVLAASPHSGVDTLAGQGLAQVQPISSDDIALAMADFRRPPAPGRPEAPFAR
jgi:uncharacterized protein YbjT (DUF2867 family)